MNRPLTTLLLAMALAAPGAAAQAAAPAATPELATMKQLVKDRQFEQAYSLGQAAAEELEGMADYDFYFGLAALETGHYPQAIFALERVVVRFPKQRRARLELARAFYLSGNLSAAKREFERVLETDPPPAVQVNITGFLSRIAARQRANNREINWFVDAGAGRDSNVNSATANGTIDTPLGTFDLSQNGVELDDSYTTLAAGVSYREPLPRGRALDISASTQLKNNMDADEFDLTIYSLGAGWTVEGDTQRLRTGVRFGLVELDGNRFQHSAGATVAWSSQFGKWLTSATGALTALRYKGDRTRNTDQFLVALSAARQLGSLTASLSLYGAGEPARDSGSGDHNGRTFYGLGVNLQRPLATGLVAYAAAGAQNTRYDEGHPVFIVVRDDDQTNAKFGLSWTPPKLPNVSVRGEARWTDVDSNIVVFEYDRTELEAGVRVAF